MNTQPAWNPANRSASLMDWGIWLHEEARQVFLRDGTHGQMLFLFGDEGVASMNPIPPNTSPDQIVAGVRRAVREHSLFGVISLAEAWIYMPQGPSDHTAFQLRDGEMTTNDLKPEDRVEALMVRLESRVGDHVTWLDRIVRQKGKAMLGPGMRLSREKCLNFASYFE